MAVSLTGLVQGGLYGSGDVFVHCGFVCDNSNVYSTCNIHTDSKCITYNDAYTSKHDIGINVHESHYSASASAFINHSLNPAQRLFCGGTQRNTAKRLFCGGTQHSKASILWRYTEEHSTASILWRYTEEHSKVSILWRYTEEHSKTSILWRYTAQQSGYYVAVHRGTQQSVCTLALCTWF